jgi:23S rRNA pseudouridine1911/1915/1917 synthase
MVVAKSEEAFQALKRAFHDREVHKVYHALVQGYLEPAAGTINAPIGRARSDEWKMAIDPQGRASVTHYETLERVARATLARVELETGRTHQIRVHMAGVRHPCVGDRLYGADPGLARELRLTRQWLHAVALGFVHPRSGAAMHFVSHYPADLTYALERLRGR